MIKVNGIDHVAINVRDLDKSLKFYTEVIGLTISKREHQKQGIEYFLDCGPSLIGLIQGSEEKEPHFFEHEGLGANHFSFRVATKDFDSIVDKLKAANVPVDYFKKREKSWSVYFRDPDGNKLEMTAWPLED